LVFGHTKYLNTPRLVADGTGTTVWKWDQAEPFGVNAPDENPLNLGAFELPFRFPGQFADKETNLTYNLSRDYDPIAGRYVQSDPIGLDGGINTYTYAALNPVELIDAEGLQARSSGNPRPPSFTSNPSTWLGRQGAWYGGRFYPRFGGGVDLDLPPQRNTPSYCPIPVVGTQPRYGGGRTNTTGYGNPFQTFIQNTAPGTYTIGQTAAGETRISGLGLNGGITQIRINPDGSVRVDIVPMQGAMPTTVHFKAP